MSKLLQLTSLARRLAASVGLAAVFTASAHAGLLTDSLTYTGPNLDLSAFANGSYNFTFGPVALPGGITFTSTVGGGGNSGQGSVLGQGSYGLAGNGNFGGSAVYAGLDGGSGYMSFALSSAVSSFGAYVNYAPGAGNAPTIGAYDNMGNLLEQWNLAASAPVSTPGGFNQFQFRGIELNTASIYEFRLSGSYIIAAASASGNPTPPSPTPTPPPSNNVPDSGSTVLLFAAGLAGVALLRAKRVKI